MSNWEERLRHVWQEIADLFTTMDTVLLGVCAHLSRELNIPVIALRLFLFICAYIWPEITAVVYVVVSFFIDSDSRTIT